jgi:hypothetical protein
MGPDLEQTGKTGEQKPPGPQSASTRQLPFMQVLPLKLPEQTQRSLAGQSPSEKHAS